MKIKHYINAIVIALVLTGCSDSFLEERPSEYLSADDISDAQELNPLVGEGNIRGIYSTMIATGSGGTDLDHDDYGHKGFDVMTDLLSGDLVLAGYNYGWYRGIAEYQDTRDFSNNTNSKPWRFYYRIIFTANNLIKDINEEDPDLEDSDNMSVIGQAKAARGFAYFYLANLFGEGDYATISGAPLVPLKTEPDEEAKDLSTGAEVYKQITDDLEDAVDLLDGYDRADENEIDQDVARGLLAYAYAAKKDYTKVKEITEDVINESGYELLPADKLTGGLVHDENDNILFGDPEEGVEYKDPDYGLGGFNDLKNYNSSWMWGQEITLDQDLDLVSWWGQMDVYTYSYAAVGDPKTINEDLYNEISDKDIRKQQFEPSPYGGGQMIPGAKFYDRSREIQGQRSITTDYLYMRIEEMYLLNAEALASDEIGDYPGARDRLKDLLEIRMPDDYQDYLNDIADSDLYEEIYKQTRIELFAEGKSYLAFKRLGKTITLPDNHLSLPGDQISFDENRASFEIPEEEILNNPNL